MEKLWKILHVSIMILFIICHTFDTGHFCNTLLEYK